MGDGVFETAWSLIKKPFEALGQATGLGQTPVSPMPTVDPRGYTPGLEFGYTEDRRKALANLEAQERLRTTEAYERQLALADEYKRVLEGKTPSLAEQQMRAGQAQAMQQAAQMAASARGGTAGLMMAQRAAQQQAALGTAGVARDTAMLRAKEIAEARGQYGGLTTSMRGMSQEQARAFMQARENVDRMELDGSMAYQRDASGLARAQAEAETKAAQATAERRASLLGKGAEVVGNLIPKMGKLPCLSINTSLTRAQAASSSATAAPAKRCSQRTTLRCRTFKTSTHGARALRPTRRQRPRALRTRRSFRPWCRLGSHCSARAAWRWRRQSHLL